MTFSDYCSYIAICERYEQGFYFGGSVESYYWDDKSGWAGIFAYHFERQLGAANAMQCSRLSALSTDYFTEHNHKSARDIFMFGGGPQINNGGNTGHGIFCYYCDDINGLGYAIEPRLF